MENKSKNKMTACNAVRVNTFNSALLMGEGKGKRG